MNRKIIFAGILSVGILISGITGYSLMNQKENSQVVYNMNPDNSQKVIGSDKLPMTRVKPQSIDQLIDSMDLVVQGTVIERNKKYLPFGKVDGLSPDDPMNKMPDVLVTMVKLKVEKVIMGKPKSDVITICQLGAPDSDDGTTKLRDGKSYIGFLKELPNENFYQTAAEESFFTVEKNKKGKIASSADSESDMTTSLSKDIEFAKYDTLDSKILIDDIKKSNKFKK